MERRQFLKLSGIAAVATGLGPAGIGVALAEPTGLGSDTFAECLNRWFYFYGASPQDQGYARLVEIQDIDTDLNVDQFSLLFRGTRKTRLPAGRYDVSGSGLNFQIYIEPTGIDEHDREFYTAYFALLQ
jgi:hypothetical protein